MKRLLLARHAEARSNVDAVVSSAPPGHGLSDVGVAQAGALREALVGEPIGLGVATRLERTRQTLDLALGGRDVPRLVLPELDEIGYGAYEGGLLSTYRAWAWANGPEAACPGGGERRVDVALRIAGGLEALLGRPEEVVLAVSHGLPIRYVLEAAEGRPPVQRIGDVPHAAVWDVSAEAVGRAVAGLRAWARRPRFADAPNGDSGAGADCTMERR